MITKKYRFRLKYLLNYLMTRGVVSTAFRGKKLILGKRNRALLAYGSISDYEPYLQDYISNLNEKFIFCDVGANVGVMSITAMQNKNCSAVYCIEPSTSFVLCEKNVSFHVKQIPIFFINKALTDHHSRVKIDYAKNAALDKIADATDNAGNHTNVINSRNLIALLAEHDNIFLKVDIEGAEQFIDWRFLLKNDIIKYAVIEVWHEGIYRMIVELADRYNYHVDLYNGRFDAQIDKFESPCNILLVRNLV